MARAISPIVCIVLLSFTCRSVNSNPLAILKKGFDFGKTIYDSYSRIVEYYANRGTKPLSEVEVTMLNQLGELPESFENIKSEILDKLDEDFESRITTKTDDLFKGFVGVKTEFELFVKYASQPGRFPLHEMRRFAEKSTAGGVGTLTALVNDIYAVFVGGSLDEKSALTALAYDPDHRYMCIKGKSIQQIIFDIVKNVVKADLHALLVKLFAYDFLKQHEQDVKYDNSKEYEVDRFVERLQNTSIIVKHVLKSVPRELWRCDSANHDENSYSKIQEVFQTFVNYENDIVNENGYIDQYHRVCTRGCSHFTGKVVGHTSCQSDFCKNTPTKQRCTGHFRDCQNVGSTRKGFKTTVCRSPIDSDRRYEYIETENGIRYGRVHECEARLGYTKLEEKNWRALTSNYDTCSYCVCTCVVDDKEMDRYFSLEPAVADKSDNKVVTGVRLAKQNHTFHLQIKQGVLGANGTIDPVTNGWKAIAKLPPISLFTSTSKGYKQSPNDPYSVTNDTKYYTNPYVFHVTYDQRTVFLDDFESEKLNTLVTGLRFVQVRDTLSLQVEVTAFDYETGKLLDSGKWMPEAFDDGSKRLKLVPEGKPGVPTEYHNHVVDSSSNQFVKFQLTDLEKDFGQNIVPFLDVQDVETKPPLPLAGVGLAHKGKYGSGGFLTLKLRHYNFARHLDLLPIPDFTS